jgi:ABC-type dipeptide/oligopeptide/nickel transport system ATPase component
VQAQVVNLLQEVNRTLGTTIVLVTHNMGVVRALADHVLVLKGGRMMEFGRADDVLGNPQSSYTRELLDAAPRLAAVETTEEGKEA